MASTKGKIRSALIFFLILLIAFLIWIYWGNTSIQVTIISIDSERIPESFRGFRIVQVSDLHNTEFGESQSKLLGAIKKAAPDLIAVTGDLIDSRHTDVKIAMEFIHGVTELAPVYYVTGNHEARTNKYAELKEQLEQAGVVILNDEIIEIEYGSEVIRLIGVNDPDFTTQGDVYVEDAYVMNVKLKAMLTEDSTYTILLSHRPELFDVYVDHNIDLVLSGHAHGGQVRLPFIGGLAAPNQGFFPHYSEGVYENSSTKMLVSRGLGNSIFPIRINNRPELVVMVLK
jgi:predicted MPP superfamily phosphohydrolase